MFQPFCNLACSANFTFRNFFLFLNADKLSQDPLDRFSRSLHQMIGICLSTTDLDLFFRFLKGRCHGNQLKSKNQRFFRPIYFVTQPFRKGLQYRNSDYNGLNRMNFSTVCTILVIFDPETPEFTLLTIAPFAAIRQKSPYHVRYLNILDQS